MIDMRNNGGNTMTFKIEANIPLRGYGGVTARKYPFNEMKPGESFLINGDADPRRVGMAARAFGKLHGSKFATRRTPEGYRCWRIT